MICKRKYAQVIKIELPAVTLFKIDLSAKKLMPTSEKSQRIK